MGRVQRKPVENQISDVQSSQKINDTKTPLCQKLRSRRTPSNKSVDEKCSSQPADHLKKTFALEHVLNNPSPNNKRIVLGDKTNKSPKSPGNHKQKLKNSPSEQQNTSHPLSFSNEDCLSPYTSKLATSKNISSGKKPVLAMKSSKGIVEKHTKSPDSDKCVYAKVQRETLRNRNLPFEEKMAQYEFEVDENEPVVKQKKKKTVKRKKKVTTASDEEYFPSQKNFKRIMFSGVKETAKKAKEKAEDDLVEQNLKCTTEAPKEDISNEFVSNNKIQMTVSSPSFSPSIGKCRNVLVENLSPVARPKSQNSQTRGNVTGLKDFSELKARTSEISSISNSKIFEKSRLSCPNLNASLESSTLGEVLESRSNNESRNRFSSGTLQLAPDVNGASISTPISNSNYSQRFPFSEVTSSTPVFSPSNRNNKTVETVPHSSTDCSVTQPHLNRRVFFVPRVSGGGVSSKELVENWGVENCFGFEDSEETELLSPLTDISLKKRLRKTTPTTSTPLFSNRRTPDHLRMFLKRKCELASTVSLGESKKLKDEDENIADSSKMDKSRSSDTPKHEKPGKKLDSPNIEKSPSVTADYFPFSNLLKQSKLDFISNPKIAINEIPKHNNQESPLLFKDPGDKTPTHFKEPARRSYVRSVRRKMRPLGDEWVEIDSEPEEEQENQPQISNKKTKKGKLSKQEEIQANKWMKNFNHQCAEIEDFELCVE